MNNARKQPSARKLLVAAIASVLVPTSASAAVGRIDFATGDVSGVDANGNERRLTRGAPINEGDTILTRRGRAQIRFTDGARTALLPDSEFRIDRYNYEAQNEQQSSGFFSLLKGGLRTITGAIGRTRRDGYRVTTPTATIGIRGTEYLAVLGNSLSVWVGEGEIEACNRGGCETFSGGESGFIADEDTKPIHTEQKPDTSAGDIGNQDYSATEDVDADGAPDVVAGPLDPLDPVDPVDPVEPPVDDVLSFADGPFYVLAVSRGDGFEGGITAGTRNPDQLVDASFVDDGLVAYTHPVMSGSIGTATLLESGGDSIVGWGRWANGTINVNEQFGDMGPVVLDGSRSHHYAIGLPATDMPVTGTASYSMIGGTSPTEADFPGTVGTLNSASLNVDFGASKVEVAVDFTMAAVNYQIASSPLAMDGDNRFRFQGQDFFTQGDNCSGSCFTRIEGFFAGEAAARAGLTYGVFPDFSPPINGAVGFQSDGPGTGVAILPQ